MTIIFFSYSWDFLLKREHKALKNIGLVYIAVIGFPFLLWRSTVNEQNVIIYQKSMAVDTYTRALEQLAAEKKNGQSNLVLRLGGLHALEKIARLNKQDHPQIMDIISAYVRLHASRKEDDKELKKLKDDVQAALTIIGMSNTWHGGEEKYFNLGNLALAKANLEGTNLTEANLQEAELQRANLEGAYLINVTYLTCRNLKKAVNWEKTYRNAELACDTDTPTSVE